jgi:hypothetical protein
MLIPGDLHFDQHDGPAIAVMIDVAGATGINSVTLIGDTFESAGLSRHKSMRSARRFRYDEGTVKAEMTAARPVMQRLSALAEPNKRHILTGNHESWLEVIKEEYPGLMDTQWWELYGDLFDGWHVHGETTALQFGKLLVCHGHLLSGALSKNSAAAVLANYPGQNTLYGHTHRVDEATTPTWKYGRATANGAWTIGHLKLREAELEDAAMAPHARRHQQGFALVNFFDYGADALGFEVRKVPIMRDRSDRPFVVLDGKVYR